VPIKQSREYCLQWLKRAEKIHQLAYMQWQQELIAHTAQVLQFARPTIVTLSPMEKKAQGAKEKAEVSGEKVARKPSLMDRMEAARGGAEFSKKV
jgi:hypothetical protein